MSHEAFRLYERVCDLMCLPVYCRDFLDRRVGRDYGVGYWTKLGLLIRFRRNWRRIETASHWLEHARMAAAILSIPKSLEGDVVECGCFKGGSSANLSLVCSLVGRRLIICDSFEGLPRVRDSDREHYVQSKGIVKVYEQGQFSGTLDQVRKNIEVHGKAEMCEMVKGYFSESLANLPTDKIVFAFVDVDLHDSLLDCLKHIWPRMRPGCRLYSHEATDLPYVSHFFDDLWWNEHCGCDSPGFVGSGCGLSVGISRPSAIGFAQKPDLSETLERVIAS